MCFDEIIDYKGCSSKLQGLDLIHISVGQWGSYVFSAAWVSEILFDFTK